ncbi:probable calcium-binding protein CML49 [Rhododendron vialii]|uniref:probable calcium-binding protein CML49 n=1 Tax=Rhododendron vialii TaxID=182163 RepID=UPI00265FE05F|nr:probable calcium-binding protein CML49 [Rhododendron vialii]
MSGYPYNNPPQGYGYGGPPPSQQPYSSAPYGAPQPPPPTQNPYAPPPSSTPYAAPSAPYAPSGPKPPKDKPYGGSPAAGYPAQAQPSYGSSSPFASLVPSAFPPGTDPSIMACFQIADRDGSGLIDDKELQGALSSYNQSFSLRTVHLLMYLFTNSNSRKIGPKEFTALYYSLQNWRSIFERFDRDRSGRIDTGELREALLSLGFGVSPVVLELLVSKFDKTGGQNRAIEYDNFIECCLTVKGLTEKFKEKDAMYSGSATFTYESFMLTVLPFLIA